MSALGEQKIPSVMHPVHACTCASLRCMARAWHVHCMCIPQVPDALRGGHADRRGLHARLGRGARGRRVCTPCMCTHVYGMCILSCVWHVYTLGSVEGRVAVEYVHVYTRVWHAHPHVCGMYTGARGRRVRACACIHPVHVHTRVHPSGVRHVHGMRTPPGTSTRRRSRRRASTPSSAPGYSSMPSRSTPSPSTRRTAPSPPAAATATSTYVYGMLEHAHPVHVHVHPSRVWHVCMACAGVGRPQEEARELAGPLPDVHRPMTG